MAVIGRNKGVQAKKNDPDPPKCRSVAIYMDSCTQRRGYLDINFC